MNSVLITGANRGLGLELTRQYVTLGNKVFAGARNQQKTAALKELANKYPERLKNLSLDVTDERSIENSRKMVKKFAANLDILINNAAGHISGESISSVQADKALALLQVNAIGPLLVCQAFLTLLKESPAPKIINISSEAGSISSMNRFRGYSYYASKAALNMFTRSLAQDPELRGMIVAAIHPGWVKTEIGGPRARMHPADSAEAVIKVIAGLRPEDTGQFFTWEGNNYPW